MNKNTWFCSDYLERLIFLMNPREEKEYCRWLFHTADLPTPPKLFVESHWRWLHFLIFQYCSHVLLLLYPKNFQQMLVLVNCPDLIIFWPRGERFVDSRHCPLVKYSTFVRLCKEISCPTKQKLIDRGAKQNRTSLWPFSCFSGYLNNNFFKLSFISNISFLSLKVNFCSKIHNL